MDNLLIRVIRRIIFSGQQVRCMIVLLLVFACSIPATGQSIIISARFDTTEIMIGQQTNFTVTLEQPAGLYVDFPGLTGVLPDQIEILSETPADTAMINDNTLRIKKSLRVTSFNTGEHFAQSIPFRFFADGEERDLHTVQARLGVSAPGVDQESGIYDIKGPFYVSWGLIEILLFILIILFVAFLVWYLIRYLRKRKTREIPESREPSELPHVIALRRLRELKEDNLWQKGMIKDYYTRLTEVVRIYIEMRFGVMAMEQTSDEIISELRLNNYLRLEQVESLNKCLYMADMVKFAKARPDQDSHEECYITAYHFVEETSELKMPGNNKSIGQGESGTEALQEGNAGHELNFSYKKDIEKHE